MNIAALHREFLKSDGISTDTRRRVRDTLFFALRGERFDGNIFVEKALEEGCRLAVTDREELKGQPGVQVIRSPIQLLQDLAAYHRHYGSPQVLAITGSNGKTTTKELVAAVLSRTFNVLATTGNLNNHIGVPLTLLSLKEEEVAVIEMGANHPGEIRTLAAIADPDLGMITNVGKAHLEGFGTLKGVLDAKGELFEYLAARGGKAIVDGSDPLLLDKARSTGAEYLVVGAEGAIPVTGTILGQSPFLEVALQIGRETFPVHTRLVGAYNLQNIKLAAAVGFQFGIAGKEIADAISSYVPQNQRSEVIEGGGNRVILDSYNANPTSMREAISGLLEYASTPAMVILGDMAELGDASDREHLELVRWIKPLSLDRILLVGPRFSKAVESSGKFIVFGDLQELESYLKQEPPRGFHVLVKGSRIMELEKIIPWIVDNRQ
jgi:UDP-N-acetylmuramoyl-tripeptide--D-alanyl-D-alanine ligase